jgi:cation transport ATPase
VHIADEPFSLAKGVEKLEAGLLRLRTGLWWRDVTRHGGPASAILEAFQRQHHLPDSYTQIVADLTDLSRYVQARRASHEEAERQAKEDHKEIEERARQQAEERQQQTERAIALISFVLLPVSLIFGATSAWAGPSPILFWVSFGVSAFTLALMLGISNTLRRALFHRIRK